MKKTFKLKALVLVLVAFMALTLVPNVRANEKQDIIDAAKFTNIPEITKNDAHTNVKITATAERNGTAVETTDLQAGDIITVTFSMPKIAHFFIEKYELFKCKTLDLKKLICYYLRVNKYVYKGGIFKYEKNFQIKDFGSSSSNYDGNCTNTKC